MFTRMLSLYLICLCTAAMAPLAGAQTTLAAIRADGTTAPARFSLGLRYAGDAGPAVTAALTTDDVRLTGSVAPVLGHVGQSADIYIVVKIGETFYMRNRSGTFVPWNGVMATLTPALTQQVLTTDTVRNLYSGTIPVTGTLKWFMGYKAADGMLVYNPEPHVITVTAPGIAWPSRRPYVNLADFAAAAPDSATSRRFLAMANKWVGGVKNEYAYSPLHSVIAYSLTGEQRYIQSAIAEVDDYVNAQIEGACKPSGIPSIASDSYKYAGGRVQQIGMTYDYGYDLLTDAQRARWLALMEQTTSNIWGIPSQARWGGPAMGCAARTVPWSGWAIYPPYGPNPGNNYYLGSFARAAIMMALVTREQKWLDIVEQQLRPEFATYYATEVPEGGSREGTGYGVSLADLFDNYRLWRASTGEDWSLASPHARNTITYWLHATLPTMDMYAPIGDQSRVSQPVLYDYHRTLMLQAQLLNPGTIEARWARWWLDNISIRKMTSGFNSHFDLLPFMAESEKPSQLSYYAKGAGVYFARSSWEQDASFFSIVAGQYEESHAGQEQGNFMFFKNGWLAVTSNIWSRSGIQQGTGTHNVLRFERTQPDGKVSLVKQNQYKDDVAPVIMESSDSSGTRRGSMDLSPAFSANRTAVQAWQRDFTYNGNNVTIHDTCQVGAGVTPVWQVHVPSRPVYNQASGNIVTENGKLTITPRMSVKPRVVIDEMRQLDADFAANKYRVSLYSNSGCEFTVDLVAQ